MRAPGTPRPELPLGLSHSGRSLGAKARHPALCFCSIALALVLLASCARPPVRPVSLGSAEVGLASWYGPDFHGRRTSSGEVYDMYQLTAAHRELPLGTWIMAASTTPME